MFGTLRHGRSSEEPYSLEPTDAPFGKRRQGMPVRTACVACRERKAKCTGEEYGCQRCQTKNIECQYSSTQRKRPATSSRSAREDSTAKSPPLSPTVPGSQATFSNPSNGGLFHDPELTFSSDLPFSFDFQIGTVFEASTQQIPPSANSLAPGLTSSTGETLYGNGCKTAGGGSGRSHPLAPLPSCEDGYTTIPSCSCFSRAMCTYEAIEVNLVNGLVDRSTSTADLLQHTKTCLAECEDLLRCHACRAKSEYVMLILSMCEKIAHTLEGTWSMVLRSASRRDDLNLDETDRRSPWGMGSDTRGVQQTVDSSQKSGGIRTAPVPASMQTRRLSAGNDILEQVDHSSWSSEGEGGGTYRNVRRRLKIGVWLLDDDDENHVLRGLLAARIGKFATLLAMLRDLVDRHQWPVHKGLAIALQRRMKDSFNAIQRRA